MSDSAKLRFVYGVLTLIGTFLCFGICILIIFSLIFLNINEDSVGILVFAIPGCFILACLSVHYFRYSGIIQGQDMKAKDNKHT